MLSHLIVATVLAQTPPTSVDFVNLISHLPKLNMAEPVISIGSVNAVFVPAGDFTAKVTIESNGKVLKELPLSHKIVVGTQAVLQFRTKAFESLGIDEGTKKITVFINDKPVGVLEFDLKKSTGGDAYENKTLYTVTGPWQTHAFLTHPINTTNQQRINFEYFMASTEIGTDKIYKVDLVMRRGNTVLAKSLRPRDINFTDLVRKQEPLHKPDGQPLMVPDLTKINGPFILEIKNGTKVIRSYRGEIENGQFKSHRQSALSTQDPTKFLTERIIGGQSLSDVRYTWVTTTE